MAVYKCKSFKRTRTKVCAKYRGRKCIRKKTVSAKRCKDFGIKGKVRGGIYKGGKIRKRARRA